MGSPWGLINQATAQGPEDFLADLIAEAQGAEEAKFKRAGEVQKRGIDERRMIDTESQTGLNREKFGADRSDKEKADAAYKEVLAKMPPWQRLVVEARNAAGANISARDMAMSPEQQRTAEQEDELSKITAKAGVDAENDKRTHNYRTSELQTAASLRPEPRESGPKPRNIFSADANRIAELDTSVNDLGVLRETLEETKRSTGTLAGIQAGLPNVFSDKFGVGIEAKKRQAVIDRVKQVIGKALEGGVLHREDEVKYEKILPTMSDSPAVAKTKLDGLEHALVQRRSTTLDSLEDAGFNVEHFKSRAAARPKSDGRVYYDAQGNLIKKD